MRISFILVLLFSALPGWPQEESKDSLIYHESYFKLDSDVLSTKERRRIDSVLAKYPPTVLEAIYIYGHTDSLADNAYNLSLSKRRVQSLLQYLVARGTDPILVRTEHYGEEKPRYDNSPETRFKNRRVELTLIIDPSRLPKPEAKLEDLPFRKGDKVRLPNLNFVGNQPVPQWQSIPVLGELLIIMLKRPDLKVQINGHVCCADNQELSEERARFVYYFLQDHGIEKTRLSYRGFSNDKPLFPETSRENKALNRRVEVEVLANSDQRKTLESKPRNLKIKAPVLDINFIKNTARFSPSGDFNLGLLAEMLKDSEGYRFDFTIYDNIDNPRLTKQRSMAITRLLRKKKVPHKIYNVQMQAPPNWMERRLDKNIIILEVKSEHG